MNKVKSFVLIVLLLIGTGLQAGSNFRYTGFDFNVSQTKYTGEISFEGEALGLSYSHELGNNLVVGATYAKGDFGASSVMLDIGGGPVEVDPALMTESLGVNLLSYYSVSEGLDVYAQVGYNQVKSTTKLGGFNLEDATSSVDVAVGSRIKAGIFSEVRPTVYLSDVLEQNSVSFDIHAFVDINDTMDVGLGYFVGEDVSGVSLKLRVWTL